MSFFNSDEDIIRFYF